MAILQKYKNNSRRAWWSRKPEIMNSVEDHPDAPSPKRPLRRVIQEGRASVWHRFSRRMGWFLESPSLRGMANMALAGLEFAFRRKRMLAVPVALKIDLSPLCNLKCTMCLHARPCGVEALEKQRFCADQKMSVEQYRALIDQVRHTTRTVSLYYMGDPLMHPDLAEICRITTEAGINSHINTNFSFNLSDDKLRSLIRSGLTHFSVCLDGLSQELYQRTRVGGRVDLVLSNLKRICQLRSELGAKTPRIEVQYIKYQHNVHEVAEAERVCSDLGVDQFSTFWGLLSNCTDADPDKVTEYKPKKRQLRPRCFWPYLGPVIKYNGDVIPCCTYRHGSQYAENGDCRVLGNVFAMSLREIWNSPAYQRIRKLVCNPALVESDASYRDLFCDKCDALFDVTESPDMLSADRVLFEQVYTLDRKGHPIRRPRTLTSIEVKQERSDGLKATPQPQVQRNSVP